MPATRCVKRTRRVAEDSFICRKIDRVLAGVPAFATMKMFPGRFGAPGQGTPTIQARTERSEPRRASVAQ